MKIKMCVAYFMLNILGCLKASESSIDPMGPGFALNLVAKMARGENIVFTKYGDGEHACMINAMGGNCDGDSYHSWLGTRLKDSLISLSRKHNTYIGKWFTANVYDYCDQMASQAGIKIPWVWYYLFVNDNEALKYNYMYSFAEFVIHSQRKKIYISNSSNKRIKDFFRADVYIEIPARNWSYEYAKWLNIVEKHIEKDAIILISGGLCSKVLIDDITNKYDVTCIDLGSAFDLLATKKPSRRYATFHTYQDEVRYYKKLLPDYWV